MIEIKNLTKSFNKDLFKPGFTALNDVSFSLKENEIIGFLGANGAGKTTTIKLIMGFTPITSGSINFSDKLGETPKEILANIGYLPERPYLYPYLSGQMFLEFLGKLNNLSNDQIKKKSYYWSERLKITAALQNKIKTYSKGMLQRLGLVSALLHDPKVIILDEPLSGLDPVGRKDIKDIIIDLHHLGKTVFFSSHIVSDVESMCEKVIFLEQGKLVYEGSIDRIIHDHDESRFEIECLDGNLEKINEKPKVTKNNLTIFEIDDEKKDNFVKKLIDNQFKIISLRQKKPSLEEVVYRIKNN